MQLYDSVTSISGVGPAASTLLTKLGITSIYDLLYYIPSHYDDQTAIVPINRLSQLGEEVTIIGTLNQVKTIVTRTGKSLQLGKIADTSGTINVCWFNQPFIVKNFAQPKLVRLHGKVSDFSGKKTIVSPTYEFISDNQSSGKLVPVYAETKGLTSKWLNRTILKTLANLDDFFPAIPGFPDCKQALMTIHQPTDPTAITKAKARLSIDELAVLMTHNLLAKHERKTNKASHALKLDRLSIDQFITTLPFKLLASQMRSANEILLDLADISPMNRLLVGDVGSGKTVVASIACLATALNQKQTIFLAPTQILATQHYTTLNTLFSRYPKIKLALLTAKTKNIVLAKNTILITTHALFHHQLNLTNVGLVIIDEQQKFGVVQRSQALTIGKNTHLLTMSATPIPRSLALTLYGNLDISTIDEMPVGRKPIKTWVVSANRKEKAYAWIDNEIQVNHAQVYVVCPFITTSDKLQTVNAVEDTYAKLATRFPKLKLAKLHGNMSIEEKNRIISQFTRREFSLLVSTPIIEVGVNIPSASIMVVEDANRFGLSQLHQLRGRVGRSDSQSYCLLFTPSEATSRLKALEETHSGLELAELDLHTRGAGNVFGVKQHGYFRLKVAELTNSDDLIKAKNLAEEQFNHPVLRHLAKQVKIEGTYDSAN